MILQNKTGLTGFETAFSFASYHVRLPKINSLCESRHKYSLSYHFMLNWVYKFEIPMIIFPENFLIWLTRNWGLRRRNWLEEDLTPMGNNKNIPLFRYRFRSHDWCNRVINYWKIYTTMLNLNEKYFSISERCGRKH